MATAEEDDFSFPATATDSPACFVESPPLWRSSFSPTTTGHEKPEKLKGKEVLEDDQRKFNFMSFQNFKARSSYLDSKRKSIISSHEEEEEEEEEKMDMLWEDLNDEFSRNCRKTTVGREVQNNCVKTLKLSKANDYKPNILVFIKVLKKIFLMQNFHRTVKKRSW